MNALHFREIGSGFPVVLLHGFCETHQIWDGFAEKLSVDFRIIIPDLPGFGESELLHPPFSIDDVAKSILELLSELQVDKFSIVGHSLGGYVALAMIAQEPTKVSSMALFHSTAFSDSDEKKENRNRVISFVTENGVKPFIDTFVPGLFHKKDHPSIPFVHSMAMTTRYKTLVAYTAAMRDRPSRIAILGQFGKPILVLGGDQDPIISTGSLSEIARIKGTQLHLLKDVAHMGMLEDPLGSVEVVRDFLCS